MHFIDELQSHRTVIKRLRRMQEQFSSKENARDPFRKTILERIREILGFSQGTRQHWIRAKLHWFAQGEFKREELELTLENNRKLSNRQTIINDNRGHDYAVDTLSMMQGHDDCEQEMTDEYLSLLRHSESNQTAREINFAVDISELRKDPLLLPVHETSAASIECEETSIPVQKKTTSELFLSVHNFVMEKEQEDNAAMDEPAGTFAATSLWVQSNEYMPGERWNGEEKFSPITGELLNFEHSSGSAESSNLAALLHKHNPELFVFNAIPALGS